jgi:hypothetical protein
MHLFSDPRSAFEEEAGRNLKNTRNLLQPACADTVASLLVFLHLLKGQAEPSCKLLLAHFQHETPHANPRADMHVNRTGRLFSNHCRAIALSARHLFGFREQPLAFAGVVYLPEGADQTMTFLGIDSTTWLRLLPAFRACQGGIRGGDQPQPG